MGESRTPQRLPTMRTLLVLAAIVVAANALELTPDNWDSATSGKQVFIKFLAPW